MDVLLKQLKIGDLVIFINMYAFWDLKMAMVDVLPVFIYTTEYSGV